MENPLLTPDKKTTARPATVVARASSFRMRGLSAGFHGLLTVWRRFLDGVAITPHPAAILLRSVAPAPRPI
jgi:hypothetical protein